MKKILLILFLISLTACGTKEAEQPIDNNETKIPEIIPREELLKSEMRNVYPPEEYLTIENVGKSYFTTLKTTDSYIKNRERFSNCDTMKSGYSMTIGSQNENIYAIYKIYLNCDGKSMIYTYDDLSESSEPTGILEKEID